MMHMIWLTLMFQLAAMEIVMTGDSCEIIRTDSFELQFDCVVDICREWLR